jgi:hypothetical protein
VSGPAGLATALAAADAGADLGADLVADVGVMLDRPAAALLARVLPSAAAIPWLVRYTGDPATSNTGVLLMVAQAVTVGTARPGPLPAPTIALTELRVLAAAAWVGGLAALAVAVVPRRNPTVLNATLIRGGLRLAVRPPPGDRTATPT